MLRTTRTRSPIAGRNRRSRALLAVCLLLIAAGRVAPAAAAENAVYVFAAASTAPTVDKIIAGFPKSGRFKVLPVYAASGTLARQIANGAPADIYLAADPQWMTWLAQQNKIIERSRIDLIGNCLVLAQAANAARPARLTRTLAHQLGDRRLGLADPALAPLGAYARAALQSMELWKSVEKRVAYQPDARSLLVQTERGELGAAILYASSAWLSQKVRIADRVPPAHAPKILYPAAMITARARAPVRQFFKFLRSERARKLFLSHGFVSPGEPCPS